MGFGLSGSPTRTSMDGADVTIAWVDNSRGANALDYHLESRNRVQVCYLVMLGNFYVSTPLSRSKSMMSYVAV